MLIEVDSKRELLMYLRDNIDDGENNCYTFGEYSFYRDGETGYKVFDSDGNDMGTYDILDIDKSFIKKRIMKKKVDISRMKQSPIKKKARKKKDGDIIILEFMEWLHTKRCVVHGCQNASIEAHHVLGRQPRRYDNLCVPLCPEHHRGSEYSWHEGNVKKFRADYSREKLADMSIKLFHEWIDEGNAVDNEGYYRFITDRLFDRQCTIQEAIKMAVKEYEYEQLQEES
jgi:hypothetical protein